VPEILRQALLQMHAASTTTDSAPTDAVATKL
jgi:hypothetical protein